MQRLCKPHQSLIMSVVPSQLQPCKKLILTYENPQPSHYWKPFMQATMLPCSIDYSQRIPTVKSYT